MKDMQTEQLLSWSGITDRAYNIWFKRRRTVKALRVGWFMLLSHPGSDRSLMKVSDRNKQWNLQLFLKKKKWKKSKKKLEKSKKIIFLKFALKWTGTKWATAKRAITKRAAQNRSSKKEALPSLRYLYIWLNRSKNLKKVSTKVNFHTMSTGFKPTTLSFGLVYISHLLPHIKFKLGLTFSGSAQVGV